jgi:hypothetical protein
LAYAEELKTFPKANLAELLVLAPKSINYSPSNLLSSPVPVLEQLEPPVHSALNKQ